MKLFATAPVFESKQLATLFNYFDKETLIKAALINRAWLAAAQDFIYRRTIYTTILQQSPVFSSFTLTNFDCQKLAGGMTNYTFVVTQKQQHYVVRIPGKETNLFINRRDEAFNAQLASQVGINPAIVYCQAEQGSQVTMFLEDAVVMSKERLKQPGYLTAVVGALKTMHHSGHAFANTIDVFARNAHMQSLLAARNVTLPSRCANVSAVMPTLQAEVNALALPMAPCHNDTTPPNFLLSNQKMYLIDWEYSGNNWALWDLVCLAMEGEFAATQIEAMLTTYYDNVSQLIRSGFTLLAPVYEFWVSLWCYVQLVKVTRAEEKNALQQMAATRLDHCETLLASHPLFGLFKVNSALLPPVSPAPLARKI